MEHAASTKVPCRKASEALLAAHVCQLIASDYGEHYGGVNGDVETTGRGALVARERFIEEDVLSSYDEAHRL